MHPVVLLMHQRQLEKRCNSVVGVSASCDNLASLVEAHILQAVPLAHAARFGIFSRMLPNAAVVATVESPASSLRSSGDPVVTDFS